MFLLTRPYQQSFAMSKALEGRGILCFIEPMLKVVALKKITPKGYKTLIITSRNTLDFLESLSFDMTIYCVGKFVEKSLKAKGIHNIYSFTSIVELLEFIKTKPSQSLGSILYAAGESKTIDIEASLKPLGYLIQTKTLYKTETPKTLSLDLIKLLKNGEVRLISFFSKKTAETFVNLVKFHSLEFFCSSVITISFSQNIDNVLQELVWKKNIITKKSSMNSFWQVIKNHVG